MSLHLRHHRPAPARREARARERLGRGGGRGPLSSSRPETETLLRPTSTAACRSDVATSTRPWTPGPTPSSSIIPPRPAGRRDEGRRPGGAGERGRHGHGHGRGGGALLWSRCSPRNRCSTCRATGPSRPAGWSAVIRLAFNPNGESVWFLAVMQIVNMVTLLGIVLTGAALIREREHGTIEHLLVMPLTLRRDHARQGLGQRPGDPAGRHLRPGGHRPGAPRGADRRAPLGSSCSGLGVYLFSLTALGILLATLARTMPQFGLLSIPVFLVMYMLSGANTPLDSMPELLQRVMRVSPTTHFVAFVQSVVFRGAGLDLVWSPFGRDPWAGGPGLRCSPRPLPADGEPHPTVTADDPGPAGKLAYIARWDLALSRGPNPAAAATPRDQEPRMGGCPVRPQRAPGRD